MNNPEKWNSEEKRLERKERLNSLKAKDGKKKPIKKSNKFMRIFLPVLAVVLVLAIGIWGAIYFALPQKIFAPMSIGGKKVSSVEFSYFYANALNQLSIDKKTDEGKAKLKALCTETGFTDKTWQEYTFDLAAKAVTEVQIQYDLAMAEKIALTAEDKQSVKDIFAGLITQVGDEVKADAYLIEMFGKGVTIATLTPVFEKQTLASKYAEAQAAKITVSDQEIKGKYEADKNLYDSVTFRLVLFAPETKDGATTAETAKFDAAAKTAAEAFLKKATTEAVFKQMAADKEAADEKLAYSKMTAAEKKTADEKKAADAKAETAKLAALTAEEKAAYQKGKSNQDLTILRGMKKDNIDSVSTDMGTWLFDTKRKLGDKDVFSAQGGYYVIYFVSRDSKFKLPTVRHILISPNKDKNISNGDAFTAAEWAQGRKTAQTLLKQCTTLEKFISLVKANTTDTGSADTGGLYENVQRGQMMPEFNDWCFDPARKANDQAIVRTDYGFHIIRFIETKETTSLSQNSATIKSGIASKKYSDQLDVKKALPEYKYVLSDFGISLMGL